MRNTNGKHGPHEGFAHVTLCIAPNGKNVDFFPEGDPIQIAKGLQMVMEAFHKEPGGILHASGLCEVLGGEIRKALE